MATLLADPPPAACRAQRGPRPSRAPAARPEAPAAARCTACGAPLAPGQDWCLQCGAAAPDGGGSSRRWGAVAVATAVLLLVLGAAAAGYAALTHKPRHAVLVTKTVAAVTPPASTPPPSTTTTPSPAIPVPQTATPAPSVAKPPKIPLQAVAPAPAVTTPPPTTTAAAPSGEKQKTTSTTPAEPAVEALLLDTDAASTYNPYNYPATQFGDPSLAIDGDTSTGWTAQVDPASAPAMAEGLAIDLKGPQKLAAVKLVTTTPGIVVQVYGSAGKTLPTSITDPAWVALSHAITLKKRHARIGLRHPKKSYRWLTVWVSKAPPSAVGTPQAPGRVTINELELIPPAG